ncbi:unnamed protein product [Lathyrus sativus]|nr:unnamed protein product [Lathyrus sativus]
MTFLYFLEHCIFFRLFEASNCKSVAVADCGSWVDGHWHWELEKLNIEMNGVVEVQLCDLVILLAEVNLVQGMEDCVGWPREALNMFCTKSCYRLLSNESCDSGLDSNSRMALDLLWKTRISLKIKVFGWRMILNRLASRVNLAPRGLITNPHEKVCVFCFQS